MNCTDVYLTAKLIADVGGRLRLTGCYQNRLIGDKIGLLSK